jgi:protein phosphatase-4 regulatory subunit 3
VWTDRQLHLDIALSFQDPDGCDDIWQFILEVQKHLSNQIGMLQVSVRLLTLRRAKARPGARNAHDFSLAERVGYGCEE